MKMIYKIGSYVLLCLIIISCGTGRISNLERKPNEAIVIAKMRIIDKRNNITKSSGILFDETFWNKYSVNPDDSSYIYIKLPLGKHYIARIEYGSKSQNLPENLITFNTPESRIYYIGDINMQLFTLEANYGFKYGIIGTILYETRDVDTPLIYVENNYIDAKTYFTNLFPTNEEIILSIAEIDSNFLLRNIDFYEKSVIINSPDSLSKSYQRRKMK